MGTRPDVDAPSRHAPNGTEANIVSFVGNGLEIHAQKQNRHIDNDLPVLK